MYLLVSIWLRTHFNTRELAHALQLLLVLMGIICVNPQLLTLGDRSFWKQFWNLYLYGETETKVGVFNIFKLSRDGLHLKQPAPRVLFIPIEHSVSCDDLFRAKS